MASGLPTLTTNYSGPAAYLTEENSVRIRIAGTGGNRQAGPDGDRLRRRDRRRALGGALLLCGGEKRDHRAVLGDQLPPRILRSLERRRRGLDV